MCLLLFVPLTLCTVVFLVCYDIWSKPIPAAIEQTDYWPVRINEIFSRFLFKYPVLSLGWLGTKWQMLYSRLIVQLTLFIYEKFVNKLPENIKLKKTVFNNVPVYVYEPAVEARKSNGALIFIHGGGFVLLSNVLYNDVMVEFVKQLGCVVVSIDYRLAPEHPFPAAVLDCQAATIHFLQHCQSNYRVDPSKVVICGDSAGGNLTAVIAQRLSKRKDLPARIALNLPVPNVQAQVAIYPVVQAVDMRSPSRQEENNVTGLLDNESVARWLLHYMLGWDVTGEDVRQFMMNQHMVNTPWKGEGYARIRDILKKSSAQDMQLIGKSTGKSQLYNRIKGVVFNQDFAPIFASDRDLRKLPATMVVTCQSDVIRDDGEWYVGRLREAGASRVVWKNYEGGLHGSLNLLSSSVTGEMLDDIADFIRDQWAKAEYVQHVAEYIEHKWEEQTADEEDLL